MSYLVKQMGHVALSVANPDVSASDLVGIVGLKITEKTDDTIYLSSNTRHHEISLKKGDKAEVLAMGIEAVSPEAIDEIYRRIKSEGLDIIDDKPIGPRYDRAIRFVAPGGGIIEVHTPIARSEFQRHNGPGSRPRRIEHVNMLVPDPAALGEFCEKLLGMKLSDRTGDDMLRWYRAEDGFHHTIAIGPGPGKLHHYAFDLHSAEDLIGIADNLASSDRAMLWGPGRHGAGGNIFTYYIDPDGCIVENSIEMDRIDNDAVYEPRTWDISEGLNGRWINFWGSPPPPTFGDPGIAF